MVQLLMDYEASRRVQPSDEAPVTALHIAALIGENESIRVIVQGGLVNVNVLDGAQPFPRTPIAYAALGVEFLGYDPSVLKVLRDVGANLERALPDLISSHPGNPLATEIADTWGLPENMVNWQAEIDGQVASNYLLWQSTNVGFAQVLQASELIAWRRFIEICLEAGADPNHVPSESVSKRHDTMLHRAMLYNHGDTLVPEMLLKAGADPNALDDGGHTPLSEYLIRADGSRHFKEDYLNGVESMMCQKVRLLHRNGADIKRDSAILLRMTADTEDELFADEIRYDYRVRLELLVSLGADVNCNVECEIGTHSLVFVTLFHKHPKASMALVDHGARLTDEGYDIAWLGRHLGSRCRSALLRDAFYKALPDGYVVAPDDKAGGWPLVK
ncbi:hypothetical protein SUNI508_12802 [Seiridium unicorne]|uniref:Ankyrin n=1 Tax=Seiridium unicorne TaxID=138068 RepID=A0ABR2VHF2_9PEZI